MTATGLLNCLKNLLAKKIISENTNVLAINTAALMENLF